MINLIPPDIKIDRKYARQNRKLLQWLMYCIIGIVGLGFIAGGGFYFLERAARSQEDANKQLAAVLKVSNVEDQITAFKDFAGKLQTVTNILDRQYLFSNLVRRLGGTVPPGAILTSISLTGEDRALDLTFNTVDSATANLVLVNLNDKNNGLFKQADTTTINCEEALPDATTVNLYPCSTSIKVLFYEDTNFVLLNALLTEQSVVHALQGSREATSLDDIAYSYGQIEGIKDTITVQLLHDKPSDPERVIKNLTSSSSGAQYEYTFKNANGKNETLSTPYFSSIVLSNTDCNSAFTDPQDITVSYNCATILRIAFALDESETERSAEEKEQNGTDSLMETFIDEYGGQ